MLDVFHVCLRNNDSHRWTFVSCEDRAKISGTKDEKLKCFGFYEDPLEERLKFDEVRRFIFVQFSILWIGNKE